MPKQTKNQKKLISKVDPNKTYSLREASSLVKEITFTKFDSSIDMAIRLGVDPKKATEMVRGIVALPHGTGKKLKVLALVPADKENEAKEAGADFFGLDEYLQKIKEGWTDIDVIVTMPSVMGKLGPLGKILGPRGLMPNPKVGTVTPNVAEAVKNAKAGQVRYRNDKNGIINTTIGKVSFDAKQLQEHCESLLVALKKAKPSSAKGSFLK